MSCSIWLLKVEGGEGGDIIDVTIKVGEDLLHPVHWRHVSVIHVTNVRPRPCIQNTYNQLSELLK